MRNRNEFLLSICIPTYNNLNELKRQINYLLGEHIPDDCEIIVSNNCSSDGTYDYLEGIRNDYKNIRVFHQNENIGAENNYQFLIQNAYGKYFLLCGDDDRYSPGAIKRICFEIENEDISWYFIKYDYLLENDKVINCKVASINGIYNNGIDLFNLIATTEGHCGSEMFISANVLKTTLALDALEIWNKSKEKEAKNMSLSLGMCLHAALNGASKSSSEVMLQDNCINPRWSKYWGKVTFRDQLATLDLFCKANGKDMRRILPYRKIQAKGSEYLYALSKIQNGYLEDNFAFKWYLKNAPYYLLVDIYYFMKRCFFFLMKRISRYTKQKRNIKRGNTI